MSTPRETSRASTSTALTASKPPTRSLNRQVVLEEDEYTAALSAIIARDFFPSLAHIDATNSYLNALESEDSDLINASASRLADLASTPSRTPWQSQTPFGGPQMDTPLRSAPPSKKPRYDTSLSLDAFQAKYTSEDNASFTEILDEENKKRKEKWGWAWEAEKRAKEKKGKEIEGRQRLHLEAGGYTNAALSIEGGKTSLAITEGETHKKDETMEEEEDPDSETEVENAMELYKAPPTDPEELQVDVMAPRKDTRSASIPGWNFKARNALMFAPDADESPYHQSLSTADASARGDPKAILHSNTRLPSSFEDNFPSTSSAVPPSPARSRVAAAIAGTPYRPHVETPRIQGFGFVDALPSPTPEQLGPKRVKELMTWGTLLGTPRVVGGDDTAADEASSAATPFRINPPTSRDALGRKLGSAASKSLRAKASLLTPRPSSTRTKKGDMPPPSSTPRRAAGLDLLSPAGRNLLDRTKMGGSGLVARDNPWSSESARKRGKELDLGKVGWSPRDTPLTKRR